MTRSRTPDPDPPRRPRRPAVERRPYPSAPTMTRPSPARPDGAHRARPVEPIPSTVWLCPPDPNTGTTGGVAEVVAQAVTSFSAPGEQVGVLAWPTPAAVTDTGAAGVVAASLADAVPGTSRWWTTAITALGRRPIPLRLAASDGPETGPPALLLDRPDPTPAPPHPTAAGDAASTRRVDVDGQVGPIDLIITEVAPGAVDETTAGRVTLAAAGALRRRGVLVVLTHCDHQDGVLIDPGAVLVTAGQNADLLYLQHIVAVRAPIRTDGDHPHPASPPGEGPDGGAAAGPHRRVHSDVYVLAHQQDHHTDARATVAGPTRGAAR